MDKETRKKLLGQRATVTLTPKTTKEIKATIKKAETNHGFISIRGYENSQGAVTNYLVQPLGEHGYERILKESLDGINTVENTKGFNENVFAQAKEELKVSFEKSLKGEHDRKNNFSKEDKAFYSHAENEAIYIRNIVVVSKQVIIDGEYKKVNSAEKTIAKAWIKKQLPIGKYQACFKLTNGKFEKVSFNHNSING